MTIGQPSRHGPNLPYSLVAGVTPCRGGWLIASAKLQGTVFAPEDPVRVEAFIEVVDMRPAYSTIALNAPIGGLNQAVVGGRTCDREARALLGRRGASIKSAPVQIDTGREIDLLPDHLDAITRTLLPRYQEVAAEMAPFRQRTIFEVHSDLSFYQLNGDVPLRWSKHSEKGMQERRGLLEEKVPGVTRILDAEVPGASAAHLLDAAAFLWTRTTDLRPCRDPDTSRPGVGRAGAQDGDVPLSPADHGICGWRPHSPQNVWCVNGRKSSGPANTATAHPSERNTPYGIRSLRLMRFVAINKSPMTAPITLAAKNPNST